MSFSPNIPQVTDPTLQSFQQLRSNFQSINAAFANNHVGLTADAQDSGKHTVLTMRPLAGDPATTATQTALYQKLVSSIPEMFFRPNNSQTPIQMTYPSIKADSTGTQYSFIAGPFIVYGGFITGATNGQVVTLTPGTTLLYVDLTVANAPAGVFIKAAAPTSIAGMSFNITFQTIVSKFDIFYFAIGM